MEIVEKLIPRNIYNRPGTKSIPKKICIHYTGNPGSGAANAAAYQMNVAKGYFKSSGPNAWTSSQYVVGIMGEVIRCVPDSEIAYAAAGNNSGVIHIEVCHTDKTGVFSSAAVKALSELVPYLMKRHNITAAGVVRHYDLTGKRCPLYYVDSARWAKLKAAVTANATAAPKPLAAGDRVQVVAPYAPSAYAKTAAAISAIGTRRYITKIYPNAPYPYRIGTKKGDTSTAATTGFAAASALKKV